MSRSSSLPAPNGAPNGAPKQSLSIPPNLTPSLQILLQKQQEHAGLQALREASGQLLERVEKLAEMSSVMADGGEAIGEVLKNWPHIFAILNMFGDKPSTEGDTTRPLEEDEEIEPLPQMVRLHYTEEPASNTTSA